MKIAVVYPSSNLNLIKIDFNDVLTEFGIEAVQRQLDLQVVKNRGYND